MNPVIAHLKSAYKLLRKGWCQNAAARTASGCRCATHSSRAVCWCAWGAVEAARGDTDYRTFRELERSLSVDGYFAGLIVFNDKKTTKKSHVLALFRKTIKRLESKRAA